MLVNNSQMGKRGAVRDNSGLPVRQSGPGLGGPTTPPTAGRKPEACPPALPLPPSQSKTGQGAGDGVPHGGEAAARSSLDQIQTNHNKPLRRGKHCGKFSVRGPPRCCPVYWIRQISVPSCARTRGCAPCLSGFQIVPADGKNTSQGSSFITSPMPMEKWFR